MATPSELLTRAAGLSDPADGLAAIRELRAHLARLEATHVENGLRAGWRWSDVAAALELSKQAAHRRYAAAMRERLNATRAVPPARLAVRLARQEAEAMGDAAVGTHHVLLGLTRLEGTPVATRLAALGAGPDAARAAIATLGPQAEPAGHAKANGRAPLTPRCRAALQDALARGGEQPAPEHVLAAVLKDTRGGAARTLARLGIARSAIR
jgi:Clp amino terminal domain, pathogenicity island component